MSWPPDDSSSFIGNKKTYEINLVLDIHFKQEFICVLLINRFLKKTNRTRKMRRRRSLRKRNPSLKRKDLWRNRMTVTMMTTW